MENTEFVRFLTVASVAEILQISRPTVIALIRQGEMQGVRIGKIFRVPEPSIVAYLQSAGLDVDQIYQGRPQPSTARAAPVSSSVQTAERDPATGVNVS